MSGQEIPDLAQQAVLVRCELEDEFKNRKVVKGYDFNDGLHYDRLFESYMSTGFQATHFAESINLINQMIDCKFDSLFESDDLETDEFVRRKTGCTIFLGYTSNLISSGLREHIRFLVEHKYVDCLVTTAGGVEEDIIKCLAPTYLGEFSLKGSVLREKGINRIGNLLVPNSNYCLFEDWIMPFFDELLEDQKQNQTIYSPSKLIEKLGLRINDKSSVYYWAAINKIPVFCPALTDGSLGDMLYFHSYRNPGLILDIAQDIRRINSIAVKANKTGQIILGGGLVKHHVCNANLMRNGAEFSLFVNTGNEFDGSDSGARPDEAVSWGKIKKDAEPTKVYADATLVFPLLVAQTFAKHYHSTSEANCQNKCQSRCDGDKDDGSHGCDQKAGDCSAKGKPERCYQSDS